MYLLPSEGVEHVWLDEVLDLLPGQLLHPVVDEAGGRLVLAEVSRLGMKDAS